MNKKQLTLRPTYWASVSGGKDSLYMLNLILHNLDKYPLDGVVHYELEIDYPFIKDVIDYMESECKRFNIPFYRFKPTSTWEELYDQYDFPTRKTRWCNDRYKLTAAKELEKWLNSKGCYSIHYIGYCVDEVQRYEKRQNKKEIYPLVDFGIMEDEILQWAKTQPIFNNFYKINRRCGCMYCPMSSKINLAYLYKYYPDNYEYMMSKAKETEQMKAKKLGRPSFSVFSSNPKYNAEYIDLIVKTKWLEKLNQQERNFCNEM